MQANDESVITSSNLKAERMTWWLLTHLKSPQLPSLYSPIPTRIIFPTREYWSWLMLEREKGRRVRGDVFNDECEGVALTVRELRIEWSVV